MFDRDPPAPQVSPNNSRPTQNTPRNTRTVKNSKEIIGKYFTSKRKKKDNTNKKETKAGKAKYTFL